MKILKDFEGIRIRLTDERWMHIQEHPEMLGMEKAIEETLGAPEVVIRSLADPQARLYHRFYFDTRIAISMSV